METKNERLKQFRLYKELTQVQIANILGIKRTTYASIESGANDISSSQLEKLYTLLQLNPIWVLTGDGNMELDMNTKAYELTLLNSSKLNIPVEKQYIIPIAGVARAGYLVGNSDFEQMEYLKIKNLPFYMDQLDRGFTVYGTSMFPTLNHDDVIICRRILDITLEPFRRDSIYIFVCIDGIVIKHAQKREGYFMLISKNDAEYPPYELKFEDIYELWKAEVRLNRLP